MRLSVLLYDSTEPGALFEGDLHPAKKPAPRGIFRIETPQLDLPSGIPIVVRAEYVPESDTGELSVFSAHVELLHVAPLRAGMQLDLRLPSDELLSISTRR